MRSEWNFVCKLENEQNWHVFCVWKVKLHEMRMKFCLPPWKWTKLTCVLCVKRWNAWDPNEIVRYSWIIMVKNFPMNLMLHRHHHSPTTVLCKEPFFLGPVFNSFVHFLQYFHFYVSYDSDFFTDVLPWLRGMFFIPRSCFGNDFPPFCGHLKEKFSTKSVKKWLLDKPKNSLLSIF